MTGLAWAPGTDGTKLHADVFDGVYVGLHSGAELQLEYRSPHGLVTIYIPVNVGLHGERPVTAIVRTELSQTYPTLAVTYAART